MHGFVQAILLQHQHAWPFGVIRIILYNHGLCRVCDDVSRMQIFISEFVIAVLGYFHVSRPNQLHDSREGVAHEPMLNTL